MKYLVASLVLCFSCYSLDDLLTDEYNRTALSQAKILLLDQAYNLLEKKYNEWVVVNNKKFQMDCIGTVRAIYYGAGINLDKELAQYRGNGVSQLYYLLKDKGLLHKDKYPAAGDVIFWDNTWDANGDKVFGNDPLTHVGMVVKVDDDGTVHYIHANYVFGVVVERMNLYRPTEWQDASGKEINSALYIGSSIYRHPQRWLSGDLWRDFGRPLLTVGLQEQDSANAEP